MILNWYKTVFSTMEDLCRYFYENSMGYIMDGINLKQQK